MISRVETVWASSAGKYRLNCPNYHILAALVTAAAFIEHAETLTHARRIAEKDFQARSRLVFFVGLQLLQKLLRSRLLFTDGRHATNIIALWPFGKVLIESEIQGQNVDAGLAEKAEIAIFG